jgi:ABC-type dipeptide/oligopeptide/nickel transport system permease component
MFTYTVKRVLIMIPTFFVVSLVIFLVLNFAPGRPGQAGQQGIRRTAESANANEGYRIFKEQFNLDKPILLNTRWALDRSDVEGLMDVYLGYTDPNSRETCTPEDGPDCKVRPAIGDVVRAQDELEDLGADAVPHLYAIASEHPDERYRWFATERLSVNSKRKLVGEFHAGRLPPETVQYNREVDTENTLIFTWRYKLDDPEPKKAEVRAKWDEWYQVNRGRYETAGFGIVTKTLFDTRFARYWQNLLRGNLGVSSLDRKPIVGKIISKLKYSITLGFGTVILIYLIAVPLGVFSAVRKGSVADNILTVVLFALYSLPSFFVGVLLLYWLTVGPDWALWPSMPSPTDLAMTGAHPTDAGLVVGKGFIVLSTLAFVAYTVAKMVKYPERRTPGRIVWYGILALLLFVTVSTVVQLVLFGSVNMFPTGRFESPDAALELTTIEHLVDIAYHLVLPVFCLTYGGLAALSRYARSGLLDVIRADYIRTARAKGLSEGVVIVKHAVRNGMIPILTLLGNILPTLIGGSIVIEIIFGIPGLGLYLFESITLRDYNAVMGVFLIQSSLTLVGLLVSDLSYALVDPRISFE